MAGVSGASSSSLVPSSPVYDVFINRRGSDVHLFATDLHNSLVSRGLRVFFHRMELQVGQSIPSQIEAAIRGASVIITIFSPRYAQSQWCLDELVLALHCEATIFPVFYEVKPYDLRHGRYAEDLVIHEQKGRFSYQKIEDWRKALSHVADLHGFDLEAFDGDESELAKKVVQTVLEKFPKPQLYVAKCPTGLDDKIRDFEVSVLREGLGEDRVEARVVGIVGLAGVGKTTMAKEFFDRHKSDYKTHSFLFDVGGNAATKSLNSLQSHLIKDMSGVDVQIVSRDEGRSILAKNYSNYQALVILDGVDHVDQLDALLPITGVLHPDSLILVTSRDRGVLKSAGIVESSIYHLRGLSREHSLELFCFHAFSRPYPPPEFRNLADRFVDECSGLPLSLKVFGALVCRKNEIRYWEDMLDKLNKILPSDIYSTLRISYDSLDREEQQIFLDIACFCIGEDRNTWIRIWDASGWIGFLGFRTLQDKCLVEVDSKNIIRMHNHLRVMGRDIAASSRSMARRLWQPIYNVQDINDMLVQSSILNWKQPNPVVRGLRMTIEHKSPSHDVAGKRKRQSPSHDVLEMRRLQLLEAQGDFVESILARVQSPNLIWLYWHDCPCRFLPPWIPMRDLSVLKVNSLELQTLWEHEYQAPLELRELIIDAPLVKFPESLGKLKHLEKIVATRTSLETLPEEFYFSSLEYLELESCKLTKLWQNESKAPMELRELIIDAPLVEFPESLGKLTKLEKIVAKGTCLETFPEDFNLPFLKYLELDGCKFERLWQSEFQAPRWLKELIIDAPLVEFPESLGMDLEKIVAKGTCLETFPEDFYLPSLKYLELDSLKLQRLWQTETEVPMQLRELIIDAPLIEFPQSLGQLKHLEKLVAKGACLERFPEKINLPSLKYLELDICKFERLWQSESEAPLQLRELIIDAPLVEFPKSLVQLKHLEKIVAKWTCLETFPEEFNLPSLKYLELDSFKFQRLWQSKTEAPLQLRELIIYAPLVEFPQSLGRLMHLEKLVAKGTCLETFPEEFDLPSLKYLELDGCKFQRLWQSESGVPLRLRELIIDAPLVEFPKSLGKLIELEKIVAKGTCLKTFPEEFDLPSLKYLELDGCIFQRLWQSESGVPLQLRELIIDAPLVEFPKSLGKLIELEKIVAKGTCLETFPEEFDLPSLKYLELDGCKFQRLWQSESGVPLQLRELITDAPLVEFPKSLGQLKQLEKLVAEETNLRTLPKEFCYLPCLKYLKLKDYKMHIPPNSAGDGTSPQFSQFERSQNFPDSMDNLTNLEIDLQQCRSLEMLLTAISWSQSQILSGK